MMNLYFFRDKMSTLSLSFVKYIEKTYEPEVLGASWSVCESSDDIFQGYAVPDPLCTYVIYLYKNKDAEILPIYLYPLQKADKNYIGFYSGTTKEIFDINEKSQEEGVFDLFKQIAESNYYSFGDKIRSMTNEQIAEWIVSHDEKCEKFGRWSKEQILDYINHPVSEK